MKKELKHFIWIFGLGICLTGSAFAIFVTRFEFHSMQHQVNEIYKHLIGKEK